MLGILLLVILIMMPLLSWEFEKHQQHIQPVLYSSLLNKLIPAFEERGLNKI